MAPHYSALTEEQLKTVRFYVIDFTTSYNSQNGSEISCTSLKNYVLELQRAFQTIWNYGLTILSGPIFGCPNNGVIAVADNRARKLQSKGYNRVSHIVLCEEEIIQLCDSPSLSTTTPEGTLARSIFSVGIVTAMRPTGLFHLTYHSLGSTISEVPSIGKLRLQCEAIEVLLKLHVVGGAQLGTDHEK